MIIKHKLGIESEKELTVRHYSNVYGQRRITSNYNIIKADYLFKLITISDHGSRLKSEIMEAYEIIEYYKQHGTINHIHEPLRIGDYPFDIKILLTIQHYTKSTDNELIPNEEPPIQNQIQFTEPFTLENFAPLEIPERNEIIITRPKNDFEDFEKLFDYLFERRKIEIENYSISNEEKQFTLMEEKRYKIRESFNHWQKHIFQGKKDSQFTEENFDKYLLFDAKRKEINKKRLSITWKIIVGFAIVSGLIWTWIQISEWASKNVVKQGQENTANNKIKVATLHPFISFINSSLVKSFK